MLRGLPFSKEKLGSEAFDEHCPPSFSATASFSGEKPPTTTVPTCDGMTV
jgi:hypothetical protein